MEYKVKKRNAPGRDEVEVLEETFEEGKPEDKALGRWRQKFETREEKLKYLQNR